MIHLQDEALPEPISRELSGYQSSIDAILDYAEKVAQAKRQFGLKNTPHSPVFNAVRKTLARMCSGAQRCGYCEDSCADEVEHIRPKDLYPEAVFVWKNYLYACGPCNGPKSNRYAIFSEATGALKELARSKDAPVVAPESGLPVLIDPRLENPLDYMELDLLGTFLFNPTKAVGTTDYLRAEYTINVLRLNDRDLLLTAREEAYHSYRARLHEYVRQREGGATAVHLQELIVRLKRMQHPTVWQEMKRQQHLIVELASLFEKIPEALDW